MLFTRWGTWAIYGILLRLSFLFCFLMGFKMIFTQRAMRMKWINACLVLGTGLGVFYSVRFPSATASPHHPHTSRLNVLRRMGALW